MGRGFDSPIPHRFLELFTRRIYPCGMNELRTLFSTGVALALIILVAALLPWNAPESGHPVVTTSQPAASAPAVSTSTPATVPAVAPEPMPKQQPTVVEKPTPPTTNTPNASDNASAEASQVNDPYAFPPLPFDTINADARAALVNIFCIPHGGSLNPVSGSGVIIDPRGIVLTNAHVAQYVLLSEESRIDLSCMVRMGAPAAARFTPHVLAISTAWVSEHVSEINTKRPEGTGEHDWALLFLSPLVTSPTPLPAIFPYVTPDTRPAIGFVGDRVLAAGYPAEFVGGIIAQTGLHPVSSVSTIDRLLTFASSTVDLVSIGSVIEAQGGSSGGPVVNQWDKLIGIITTTSDGTTTAQRSLRALTADYIDRDMARSIGFGLDKIGDHSLFEMRASFDKIREALTLSFIKALSR